MWYDKNYIGWCDKDNVPLLQERCGLCNEIGRPVYLRNSGEIRPVFDSESKFLNRLVKSQFGLSEFIPKWSFIDDATNSGDIGDLIIGGENVLRFRFEEGKWNIRPFLSFAMHVLNGHCKVKHKTVELNPILSSSLLNGRSQSFEGIIKYDKGIIKNDYVLLKSGRACAIGRALLNAEDFPNCRHSIFEIVSSGLISNSKFIGSDMDLTIEANQIGLKELEKKSINRIRETCEKSEPDILGCEKIVGSDFPDFLERIRKDFPKLKKVASEYMHDEKANAGGCISSIDTARKFAYLKKDIVVSFSAGKDSLVTLDLVRKALPMEEIDVVFLDTKNEFPETYKNLRTVEKYYSIKISRAEAKKHIFKQWDKFGPPAMEYRWCCKTQKFSPMNTYIEEKHPGGVLTFSGTRRFESQIRKRRSSVGKNPWIPKQKVVQVIHEWSQLAVWLYILREGLPVNEIYDTGIRRCGCWCCPGTPHGMTELIRNIHPELIDELRLNLQKWYSSDDEKALEHWKRRKIRKTKDSEKLIKGHIDATESKEGICYSLNGHSSKVVEFLKVFGEVSKNGNSKLINGPWLEGSLIKNRLKIIKTSRKDNYKIPKKELITLIERQIYKGETCASCGYCVSICPFGAISVEPHFKIDEKKCKKCLICVTGNCPKLFYFKGDEKEGPIVVDH